MKRDSVRKLIQKAIDEITAGEEYKAETLLQEALTLIDEGTAALQGLLEQWTSTFD